MLNMHPLFALNRIEYKIYLIETVGNLTFNRGLLFNAGFLMKNEHFIEADGFSNRYFGWGTFSSLCLVFESIFPIFVKIFFLSRIKPDQLINQYNETSSTYSIHSLFN